MNKIVVGLLVSVCILGVMLIMLNDHLGNSVTPNVVEKQEEAVAIANQDKAEQNIENVAQPLQQKLNEHPSAVEQSENKTKKIDLQQAEVKEPVEKQPVMTAPTDVPKLALPAETTKMEPVIPISPVESHESKNMAQEMPKTQIPPKEAEVAEKPKTNAIEKVSKTTEKAEEKKSASSVKNSENASKPTQVAPKQEPSKTNVAGKNEREQVAGKKNATSSIKLFVVFARENGATVRIRANNAIPYSTSELHNPERLMIDLAGEWDVKAPGVPKNPIVNNVRVGKTQNTTRIVIDLKEKPRKKRVAVTDKKDGLDVFLDQ